MKISRFMVCVRKAQAPNFGHAPLIEHVVAGSAHVFIEWKCDQRLATDSFQRFLAKR